MKKETIIEKLKKEKAEINQRFCVSEIGLFGSYARGEQVKGSDLDILVDFYKPIGWDVVELKDYLQSALGMKVDLSLKKGLIRNKKLWKLVKSEVMYV